MRPSIHFYLIFALCSSEIIISRITQMTEFKHVRLADHLGVVSTSSVLQCAIECANNLACNSMSYHTIQGRCRLYSSLFDYDPFGSIDEDEWNSFNLIRDLPKDCLALLKTGNTRSGVYYVSVTGTDMTPVWCDMETDGGGWTVFQKRIDGATDFYRGWDEYTYGFGDVYTEFWLGNEILHKLTSADFTELRIDMEDFENNTAYAQYNQFAIGREEDMYRLDISGYSGNAADSLRRHNGHTFSTKDNGNTYACAVRFQGAWWYFRCHDSNLNGLYLSGNTSIFAKGIVWQTWKGNYYSLKSTKMMIRRVSKTTF